MTVFQEPLAGGHYATLGVPMDANAAVIKDAFHRRARQCHPDHHAGDPRAEASFKAVAAAYAVLRNSATRVAYDRSRFPVSAAGTWPGAAECRPGGWPDRSLEDRERYRQRSRTTWKTLAAIRNGLLVGASLALVGVLAAAAATGNVEGLLISGGTVLMPGALLACFLHTIIPG